MEYKKLTNFFLFLMVASQSPLFSQSSVVESNKERLVEIDKNFFSKNIRKRFDQNEKINCIQNYIGTHDYTLMWSIFKVGNAQITISEDHDLYTIRFETHLPTITKLFSELDHASLFARALIKDNIFVPTEYNVYTICRGIEFKEHFCFDYEKGILERTIYENTSSKNIKIPIDKTTKAPLTVLLNALVTSFYEQKTQPNLGYIVSHYDNSLLPLSAVFDEKNKAYEIFFTQEMLPGGGPMKFFYKKSYIDISEFQMTYEGKKITFKKEHPHATVSPLK